MKQLYNLSKFIKLYRDNTTTDKTAAPRGYKLAAYYYDDDAKTKHYANIWLSGGDAKVTKTADGGYVLHVRMIGAEWAKEKPAGEPPATTTPAKGKTAKKKPALQSFDDDGDTPF